MTDKSPSLWRVKPVGALLAGKESSHLRRSLSVVDLVALGIGAIIGTGIFVVTGVAAAQYAGPGLVISFVLAGLAAALAALVYAELASMIPVAGSAYTYTYAALGEFVAWVVGWNLMLAYLIASGAVAIGWGSYLVDLLRSFGVLLPASLVNGPGQGGVANLPAMAVAFLVALLIIRGTSHSARATKAIVLVKLAVIVLFIVVGIRFVDPANWRPFLPFGILGIFQGAAIVFFAYIGFDAVATAAEETKRPQRALPTGILGSLIVSTVLYIVVTLVLTGLVPYVQLNTASPVTTALLRAGVPLAGGIVAVGALAGITSVLVVILYAQSRIFFAMSRDGLLPPVFSRLHPRYRTPYIATLIVGAVVMLIGGFMPFQTVAELANIGALMTFMLTAVGVMVLRRTRPDLPRPFKTPGVPWTPVLSILFSAYLAGNLPADTWLRYAIWMAAGIIVYFAYGYRHSALAPRDTRFSWRSLLAPVHAKPFHRPNRAGQDKR
ncbi:MAG: amino acid permease [Thermoanaerobacterales bacterium]|nr:amino acid permease [Thermoanaerobacterales bacterium]